METVNEQSFRDMIEQMASDYYNSTWVEMNHAFNYLDSLIWLYDKIIEEDSYHFRVNTLGNNANTCKFLKCLTATIIQKVEGNPEQEFKSTVMKAFFRPVNELPPYYEDEAVVIEDGDDNYIIEEPFYDNSYIDDRIDNLESGQWTSSTLLEILEYVVEVAVKQDKNIMLKTKGMRYSPYNRLHYRNYQADSIFPKWIESLVEQVKSGGRKSNLNDKFFLARVCEISEFPEFDEEAKIMYDLAASVVCELSDKFTTDELTVRLSMLRPGLFSLNDENNTLVDIVKLDDMVGRDRLFAIYKIFGYTLSRLPHNEKTLEMMVKECQLDKKEGRSIG